MGNKTSGTRELTLEEKAEFEKLAVEEQATKAALEAAEIAAKAGAMAANAVSEAKREQPLPPRQPPKILGDVPVTCLKTEPIIKMGPRSYSLAKGKEIMMDPSHAVELSQGENPWVAVVRVVGM